MAYTPISSGSPRLGHSWFPWQFLAAVALVTATVLPGCGESPAFESGQKVWITLPGTILERGRLVEPHGEGFVVETAERMVRVQITAVEASRDNKTALQAGAAVFLPAEQLAEWTAGQQAHRRRAVVLALSERALGITHGWGTTPPAEISGALADAEHLGMEDAAGAIRIRQARDRLTQALPPTGAPKELIRTALPDAVQPLEAVASIVATTPGAPEAAPMAAALAAQSRSMRRSSERLLLADAMGRLVGQSLTAAASAPVVERLLEVSAAIGNCGFDPDAPPAQADAQRAAAHMDAFVAATYGILTGNGLQRLNDQPEGQSYADYVAGKQREGRESCRVELQTAIIRRHTGSAAAGEAFEQGLADATIEAEQWGTWLTGRPVVAEEDQVLARTSFKVRQEERAKARAGEWSVVERDLPHLRAKDIPERIEAFIRKYPEQSPENDAASKRLATLREQERQEQARREDALAQARRVTEEFVDLVHRGDLEGAATRMADPAFFLKHANWDKQWLKDLKVPGYSGIRDLRTVTDSKSGATEILELFSNARERVIQFRKIDGRWLIATHWW